MSLHVSPADNDLNPVSFACKTFNPANLRAIILDMAYTGATVHIGCAFSIVEILAVLYRNHLNLKEKNPNADDRDYMILSKGHGVMAQYACLYELGWLKKSDIDAYFKNGTILKGLADAHVPGVEVTGGSLGHGLSVGVGLALAAKRKKSTQLCYAIVGDGEMNEGSIWEALLFAAHFKLDNLFVIVDENRFQAMGSTQEVMCLDNLESRFESFGFDSCAIDGHNEIAIDQTLNELKNKKNGRPKALIARTVKGYGVSFMENNNIWHYTRLDRNTHNAAMQEVSQS